MAPPRDPVWEYFRTDPDDSKYRNDKFHKAVWCNACLARKVATVHSGDKLENDRDSSKKIRCEDDIRSAIFQDDPTLRITGLPIAGKPEYMIKHLRTCKMVDEDIRIWASNQKTAKEKQTSRTMPLTPTKSSPGRVTVVLVSPSSSPSKRLKLAHSFDSFLHSPSKKTPIPPAAPFPQTEFEDDVCELFVGNGWSWAGASSPRWQKFTDKWISGSRRVSAQRLSGPILDRRVAGVVERMKAAVEGKLGTGQCDGWKDISKASLVSSLVSVCREPYLVATHDVTSLVKNADTLLKLVLEDIDHCQNVLGVEIIAWCSDAGGDAASMRRKLKSERPYLVTIDCWAHQLNLIVGDYFKLKLPWEEYVDMAIELIKWFNNHSYALGILKNEQLAHAAVVLILILPILTRWTTHYLAVRRVLLVGAYIRSIVELRYEDLIKAGGTRSDAKAKARVVLGYVKDPNFWHGLGRIQAHLHPLAIATNVMQANSVRLDHVTLTLGDLYRIYSGKGIEAEVSAGILASLQSRWAKNADHTIFILAVFLNPYIRHRAFRSDNPLLCPMGLYNFATQAYQRLFQTSTDSGFMAAFWDYQEGRAEFSEERMNLAGWRAAHDDTHTSGFLDVTRIWQMMGPKAKGRQSLAHLAVRILSIVPNSAGAERTFSQMGLTHTKLRNRLKSEKVHKMVMLKMDLKRIDRAAVDEEMKTSRKRNLESVDASLKVPPSLSIRTGVASTSISPIEDPPTPPEPTTNDNDAPGPAEDGAEEGTTRSEFGNIVDEMVAASMEDGTLPALDPALLPAVQSRLVALQPSPVDDITEESALQLRNIFDFSKIDLLAYASPVGSSSLDAEADYNEFLTEDLSS